MSETERVQRVLDGHVRVNKLLPYRVEMIALPAREGAGTAVEARVTMTSMETGQEQEGIYPEYCSVVVPVGAGDREIGLAAHGALRKFMCHETDEAVTFDGAHLVEPHPELRA